MKRRTINYHLIALRSFLKFLQKNEVSSLDPYKVKLRKVSENLPVVITTTELEKIIAIPDVKTIEGKRDRAILELLFSTGLRISELISLGVDDINLSENEVLLQGAKKINRVVFLSDRARKSISDYLDNRKDIDKPMFVRYGRKMNDGGDSRLSPKAVQRLIKKYAIEAGITKKVTPHIIRHSFATNLMNDGVELQSLQILMGHTNIASTRIYSKVSKRIKEFSKK